LTFMTDSCLWEKPSAGGRCLIAIKFRARRIPPPG
jgi:hypothetical protein